jgi:hypothetical protein
VCLTLERAHRLSGHRAGDAVDRAAVEAVFAQGDLQPRDLRVGDGVRRPREEQKRRGDGDESRTATHAVAFSSVAAIPARP